MLKNGINAPFSWDFGKIEYMPKKGFMLYAKGRSTLIWERDIG
jgi:hypothetical protein